MHMKIIAASDSFKGSLSSVEAAELLCKAAGEVFDRPETVTFLIADGGEGTAEAVVKAAGGRYINCKVHDPLMNIINASYGDIGGGRAMIEMAAASGLTLVPEKKRNPSSATSYGTGELIRNALDRGFRDITVGIGGSATNDGGMGCMSALGVKFLDKNGNALPGRGEELERVCSIDISGLDSRIKDTRFTVMCDVTNPLCGVKGATYTFGPQKGAESEMLSRLEKGMINYRDEIKKQFGTDPDSIKGAGAAGGLGAALKIFLRADLRSGIDTLLDISGFDAALIGADLVITGEGRTDSQTWQGKAVCGIAKRAKEKNVPVMVLSGSIGKGNEIAYEMGIKKMVSVMKDGMTLQYAMEHAKELYYNAATEMFKNIKEEWQTWKTNTNSI